MMRESKLGSFDLSEIRARAAMSGDRERINDTDAMRQEIERLLLLVRQLRSAAKSPDLTRGKDLG